MISKFSLFFSQIFFLVLFTLITIFKKTTRDLKGLRVDSPCDYFKQRLIHKIHSLIINGAPHPILSKISLMDKKPRVFFLLGTLTRRHRATVNFFNASCSEIPFISDLPTHSLIRQVG